MVICLISPLWPLPPRLGFRPPPLAGAQGARKESHPSRVIQRRAAAPRLLRPTTRTRCQRAPLHAPRPARASGGHEPLRSGSPPSNCSVSPPVSGIAPPPSSPLRFLPSPIPSYEMRWMGRGDAGPRCRASPVRAVALSGGVLRTAVAPMERKGNQGPI
ncbi:hypothetical protein GQ55_3G457900 [Panicum hallii var. hallii]|uniref:Uncharacterized protein n=1 Tax=Panicum hallii var. hallii TaxID=1504633 RepID=A0A2T7EIR5_9POAL|nr:hypothetical protein GQ55_3G457900 [Panicum hallii var. hallii]